MRSTYKRSAGGGTKTRASIPVVPRYQTELAPATKQHIVGLATSLLRQKPNLAAVSPFGDEVRCGIGTGIGVFIGDQSEIPLYAPPEDNHLQYRMAFLADSNDLLVLGETPSPAFEQYLCQLLHMPHLNVLNTAEPEHLNRTSVAERCLDNPSHFQQICELARSSGQMTIVPYLTTGHIWRLAGAVSKTAAVPVFVAGPPPKLSNLANNKVWFSDRIRDLFDVRGPRSNYAVYGLSALTRRVKFLADRSTKVIVKIPDSAGSAGNIALEAAYIRNVPAPLLHEHLAETLRFLGWNGTFPLLAEVWETPVVSSPSVQMWIPLKDDGPPVVEGIFEQVVEGELGEFVGARQAQLPDAWQDRLTTEGAQIAFLLQQLGYFGRCSFDAIIAGNDFADGLLHWIECNARWGGVSIPMTLANRLAGAATPLETVIVQRKHRPVTPRSFRDVLKDFGGSMFTPGQSREGIVFLTPHLLETGAGSHFLTLAATTARATEIALKVQRRLTDPRD
ncbi:hypothetical protein [Roseibium sp.]|uniref:preATP grasp domain-containing protein n=1 Tax=Roseibium sp. TaxID=1936156 RepID=UPI003A97DD38